MVKMLAIALVLTLATVEGISYINNNNGNYNQRGLRAINNGGYHNQGVQNSNNAGFNNQRIANVNNGYYQSQGDQLGQNNVNYNQGKRAGNTDGTGSFDTRGRQFNGNNYNNNNHQSRVGSTVGATSFHGSPVSHRNNVYSNGNQGIGHGNVRTGDGYAGNSVGNVGGHVGNNVGRGGGYAGNSVGTDGGYAGNIVVTGGGYANNNIGTVDGYAGNSVGISSGNGDNNVGRGAGYARNNVGRRDRTHGINFGTSVNVNTGYQNNNRGIPSYNVYSNSNVSPFGNTGTLYRNPNSVGGNRGAHQIGIPFNGINSGIHGGIRNVRINGIGGNVYQSNRGDFNDNIHRGGNGINGNQGIYTGVNRGGHSGNGYSVNTIAGNGHNEDIGGLSNSMINGIHGNGGINSNINRGHSGAVGGQSYNGNSEASGLHVNGLTGAGNVLVNSNRGNAGIVHSNNVNAGLVFGNSVNGGLVNGNNAYAKNNNVVNRGSIAFSRRPTFVNTVGFGGQRNTGKRLDQRHNSFGKRNYSRFGNRNALSPSNFHGNIGNSARTGAVVVGRGPFNVQDDNTGNRYATTGNQGSGADGLTYQNDVGNGNNVGQTYPTTNNNNIVTGGTGSAASGGNVYVNPTNAFAGNVQGNAGGYPDRNTRTLGSSGQVSPSNPHGISRIDIQNNPAAANVAYNTSGAVGGGNDAVSRNCFKDVDVSNDYSSNADGMPRQRIIEELERRPFLRSAMGSNGAFIARDYDLLSEQEDLSRFQGSSKTSSLGDDFRFDTSDGFFVDGPDTGTTSGRIRDLRARQLERLQPLLKARSEVCPSNRRPLRSFNMGEQQCFIVNRKNEPTMFATCTRRDCPQCSRGKGLGRCMEVFEKATVFAWCDDSSFSDKIRRMTLLVPKYCSGMSYEC